MAPIKFEENIKDKLEKRTINPSANAWGSLSEQLGQAEVKKSNNRFWWIGVAASLVGVLLITNVFFENKTPTVLVDTKDVNNKIEVAKSTEIDEALQKGANTKEDINVAVITEKQEVENIVVANKRENRNDKQLSTQTKKNSIQKRLNQNLDKTESIAFLNEPKETKEQEVLVAELVVSKDAKVTVLDSEIELLLSKANQEIAVQSSTAGHLVPIDPNGLLQDVEDELEESFRDKMLKKVKSGYNTVRTAVVERNE